MSHYLVRRLLILVPTLFAVALLTSSLVRLVPGDPVGMMLGMETSGEAVEALQEQLGLHQPLHVWLVKWFARTLRGDLGQSIFLGESVTALILERYPVTISMTLLALLVSLVVGVPAGVIAAVRQGSFVDWISTVMALMAMSVPIFWLALNLIFLFAVRLGWLPVGGYVPLSEDPVEFLRHLFLPSASLGLCYAALIARMTRGSMLEVLRMDYIRTAQAKGLHQRLVIFRHAFRNALIPILTVVGLAIGALLGGSVVTETVFNLPGVGRLVVEAVKRRDYPVVQGVVLTIAVTYLAVNLLVDLLYSWVDPRIHYE